MIPRTVVCYGPVIFCIRGVSHDIRPPLDSDDTMWLHGRIVGTRRTAIKLPKVTVRNYKLRTVTATLATFWHLDYTKLKVVIENRPQWQLMKKVQSRRWNGSELLQNYSHSWLAYVPICCVGKPRRSPLRLRFPSCSWTHSLRHLYK